MKIKQQLLITHGILVLISLMIVFINIGVFRGMDNDATIINYAGKLRFLNYNMSQIANIKNNEENSNKYPELNESLNHKISELENIVVMLEEKNQAMSKSNKIEGIDKIIINWKENFKPLYLQILEGKDTRANVRLLNEKIDSYVGSIDTMVTLFSEHSRAKIINALTLNGGLILIIILVTIYSFSSTNNKIKKPLYLLMNEMKNLSFIDDEVSKKLENLETDEISHMNRYFNEMMYDELTKSFNRKAGLSKLSRLFVYDNRGQPNLSLCFIDINGLKDVNDKLGHKYGDELIISAVDCIKNEIRSHDFIIRMGGDEFLIVFNGIGTDIAERVWQRINNRYEEINNNEDRPYIISVSHGIVEYDHSEDSEMEILIKDADEKMYVEKRFIKEELKVQIIRNKAI